MSGCFVAVLSAAVYKVVFGVVRKMLSVTKVFYLIILGRKSYFISENEVVNRISLNVFS